jgi:outer membrane protein assembly factor BamD
LSGLRHLHRETKDLRHRLVRQQACTAKPRTHRPTAPGTRLPNTYEKLEARYPYGRYAQQAQLELGYVYWKAGEPGSALAACDRFIKLHPSQSGGRLRLLPEGPDQLQRRPGAYAGYISTQDPTERDPKAAPRILRCPSSELVTRFPNSKYTPDAIQRMNYLVNAMASQEVQRRALLRQARGAYIAAVNRAQFAITTYPQTPSVEEGMFVLVTAYDKLGMTELRDDADRIMRQNYPNSRFYKQGLERKTAWWKLW